FDFFFFFTAPATTEIYTLSLHDALPIFRIYRGLFGRGGFSRLRCRRSSRSNPSSCRRNEAFESSLRSAGCSQNKNGCQARWKKRSEEHTSELQSRFDLVCRLLLEKKKYN